MDLSVHLALVTNRFLLEAVSSLLWGMLFYPVIFLRTEIAQPVLIRLVKRVTPCAWLLVVCIFVNLPINIAMIGDGWSDALSSALWWPVITETSAGTAWQISMMGCCLLLIAIFFASRLTQQWNMLLLLLGAGLVLVSFSFTGHAKMSEGWRGVVHQISDILHVLSGASWLGGLCVLYFILKIAANTDKHLFLIKAVQGFSLFGMVSVSILVCSGMLNTLLIVGHWPFGLQNTYQTMLTGKMLLVGLMIALAIRNKVILTPRLSQPNLQQRSIASLKKATMIEWLFGMFVILSVAIFGVLDPHAGDF